MTLSTPSFGPLAISVIMPVFFCHTSVINLELLESALASIRKQDFPDAVEILVVDDGSATPVAQFTAQLGEAARGVRWIRQPIRRGLVHSLNTGIRNARYPLLAIEDVQNRWLDGKIQKQLRLFASDPALTVAGTSVRHVSPYREEIGILGGPAQWQDLLRVAHDSQSPFPRGSIVARASILRLLGGYPQDAALASFEDLALWRTWLRFFKGAMVGETLCERSVPPHWFSEIEMRKNIRAADTAHQRFREIGRFEVVPQALNGLSAALGVSVVESGILAYRLWHYGLTVRLPEKAISFLAQVLPDRNIISASALSQSRTIAEVIGNDAPLSEGRLITALPL